MNEHKEQIYTNEQQQKMKRREKIKNKQRYFNYPKNNTCTVINKKKQKKTIWRRVMPICFTSETWYIYISNQFSDCYDHMFAFLWELIWQLHVYDIHITRHVHVQEDGKEKSEGAYRYKNGWKFPSRVRRGEVGVWAFRDVVTTVSWSLLSVGPRFVWVWSRIVNEHRFYEVEKFNNNIYILPV